jgi:hypothetical protein
MNRSMSSSGCKLKTSPALEPSRLSFMSDVVSFNLAPTAKFEIIRRAFIQLCADEMFQLLVWRKWLAAVTWAAALTMSCLVDDSAYTVDDKKIQCSNDSKQSPL